VGDLALSRHEDDPDGSAVAQVVEELFIRVAPSLQLTIAGRIIATTAEHPFYVRDRGWTPAGELQPGNQLASLDGPWLSVESVLDSGLLTTVYNFRVSNSHTYFVGTDQWAFAVWAHNAYTKGHADVEMRIRDGSEVPISTPTSGNGRKALLATVADRNRYRSPGSFDSAAANKAVERMGRKGAKLLFNGDLDSSFAHKGAKLIYGGSRKGQGNGDLDLVFKKGNQYIVVEAKGGSSPLRARTLTSGPQVGLAARQGTRAYLQDVVMAMQGTGRTKKTRAIGAELENAIDQGNVTYAFVEFPLGTSRGQTVLGRNIRYGEFEL